MRPSLCVCIFVPRDTIKIAVSPSIAFYFIISFVSKCLSDPISQAVLHDFSDFPRVFFHENLITRSDDFLTVIFRPLLQ